MKTNITWAALAVCGVLAFSAGCGKNEVATPPAALDSQAPAKDAFAESQKAAAAQLNTDADQAAQAAQTSEAEKQAEAAKAEAMRQQAEAEAEKLAAEKAAAEKAALDQAAVDKTAAEKLAQTAAAAAQKTGQIQSLIDSAKNLTGQNKYAEALKILGELANLKLTPQQQAVVDGLKQTAQKQAAQAVADKAATSASKTIGDVLGGKK